MMINSSRRLFTLAITALLAACIQPLPSPESSAQATATAPNGEYLVNIRPDEFVAAVDNPYFPLVPGARYIYETNTADGRERAEIEVMTEPREVMGVAATEVRDTVYLDDVLVEDTYDWFAQDIAGNVWYLGEDVKNYDNGSLRDTEGSWAAGVDGALPGIVMFADPSERLGEPYRQEYYPGVAEDMAELLSIDESVTVPFGSFDNVVKTKEFTPLEPGLAEQKYYAKAIGMVKSIDLNTNAVTELVEFTQP